MNCSAMLNGGVLSLENDEIRREYLWNDGLLISKTMEDKQRRIVWELGGELPDCVFPFLESEAGEAELTAIEQAATPRAPAHLLAAVSARLGSVELRREFRLYAGCPAIACDYFLRARPGAEEEAQRGADGSAEGSGQDESQAAPTVIERLCLPGRHWRLTAVQFCDVTDRNNNLVQEESVLAYRGERRLTGNLLFADHLLEERGLFVLKEAPCSDVQLCYPGADFACRIGEIVVLGAGIDSAQSIVDDWTRLYGFVTGVTDGTEYGRLSALRTYQEQVRVLDPARDDMVLMNTWGDRGQDTRISESFCLAELEAGARLGISHFQLDDGWQRGRSHNSAYEGGSDKEIWSRPDFWSPHPERFPNGLGPVVQRGKELGIEVCVWFNPSGDDEYAHWQDDAGALIQLYRDHGIRTFKIDGVDIPTKRAEMNVRRMLDSIMDAAGEDAVFNLDVTASRRFGYHYFREYGNIFLENRYTDWSNYYPHWTLRNLWVLSRYVPAQSLQIEFLNKWRNPDNYGEEDPLAPRRVPFDYLVAIAFMAQPLAWLEGTGLPEEAFSIAPVLKIYREHQGRIHAGQIFPIGGEPCGTGWTGFQSINGDKGYLLVFRELNERPEGRMRVWNLAGREVTCRSVLGHGADFTVSVGQDGQMSFQLAEPYSYALYTYEVV